MAHRRTPSNEKDNKQKPPASSSPEQQSDNDDALQRDQLQAIFKQVDHNKDGYIDSNDLGNLMQRLNITTTQSELTAMIKAQRAHNSKAPSGHLDFNGFCEMMQRNRTRLSLTLDTDIRVLFQAIDRNKDGRISMPELRESMRASIGSAVLSETDIHMMFQTADANQDGFISFDEFTQMTQQVQDEQLRDKQQQESKQRKKRQSKKQSPK